MDTFVTPANLSTVTIDLFTVKKVDDDRWINVRKPRDCYDLYSKQAQTSTGKYTVFVGVEEHPKDVYCDMETDQGGWTVVSLTVLSK